jgi:transcriptional regulator with XRE-family HTH domain
MLINITYRLPNGIWQSDFSAESVEEFCNFFLGRDSIEYRISVDINDIPLVLKGIRKAKDLTLQNVADGMDANYDRSVLQNIESSRRKLGLKTLEDICQSMKIHSRIELSGFSDFKVELERAKEVSDDNDFNPSIFEK